MSPLTLPVRHLVGVILLLASASCGPVRQILAPNSEYAAYREFRLALTVEAKLRTGAHYLRVHPQGRWKKPVSDWFSKAELAYWEWCQGTLPRVHGYLIALPDGPHAAAAQVRARELWLAQAQRQERHQAFLVRVQEIEAELATAERQRKELLVSFTQMVTHLASVRSFDQPVHALTGGLSQDWQKDPQGVRCSPISEHEGVNARPPGPTGPVRCTKSLSLPYAIPEQRRVVQRAALVDIVLETDSGNLRRVVLTGPELFSRLHEAMILAPVQLEDLQARIDAVARALDLIKTAIERELPEARCGAPSTVPAVLERACDGVRLRVIPAPEPDQEDRLILEPVP